MMMIAVQTTKEKVLALRAGNPLIPAADIARHIGVSRERVRQLLVILGLPTRVLFVPTFHLCGVCGAPSRNPSFCSRKCQSWSTWVIFKCAVCGRGRRRRGSEVRARISKSRSGNLYCSRKCFFRGARLGRKSRSGLKCECEAPSRKPL